jgi:putative ABC transport system permease protein
VGVTVQPLENDRVGNLRPVVQLLMGAVILILLISCSNVANLLLVRNSGRGREIAVRAALGAERSALIRQFMTENLVLGFLAGGLGCALAWLACSAVAHLHPARLPQLTLVDVDLRVLTFAVGISILSSLLFGILPAWISSGVNLSEALKEAGGTRTAVRSRQYVRRLLVASEMAFAVMLLVGAGLLAQSLLRLQNQQPGFRVDHLLRTHLFLPSVRYPNPASITRFSDDYAARVRQLPGVLEATISAAYPPDDEWIQNFTVENRPLSRLGNPPSATFNVTDSHYLHTLGIPLLKGRDFTESDTERSMPIALVNQTFVSQYFSKEDPLGKELRLDLQVEPSVGLAPPNPRFRIVGVIGDSLNRGLALAPEPQITTLYRQTPGLNYGFKNLIVRTALDPLQMAKPIRRQLQSLDSNLPFAEVSSMSKIMERQTADRRYTTGLLVLFACCGGVLAVIGVYGVVSHVGRAANQRNWFANGFGRRPGRRPLADRQARRGNRGDRSGRRTFWSLGSSPDDRSVGVRYLARRSSYVLLCRVVAGGVCGCRQSGSRPAGGKG